MTLAPGGMLPKSFPSTQTWNVGLNASLRSSGGTEVPGGTLGADPTTTLNSLPRIVAPSTGSVTRILYSVEVGGWDCGDRGSCPHAVAARSMAAASASVAVLALMTQSPFGAAERRTESCNFHSQHEPPAGQCLNSL